MENEIESIVKQAITEMLSELGPKSQEPVDACLHTTARQATIERLDEGYLVCLWSQNCNRRVVRAEIEDALADVSNFLLDIK